MTIAIVTGSINGRVLEVTQNEAASLEAMAAYANLGHRELRRVLATDADFAAWSNGAELQTDAEYNEESGKFRTILVEAS